MINIKKYHPLKQMFRIRKYGNANKREEEEGKKRARLSDLQFLVGCLDVCVQCTLHTHERTRL